MSSNNGISVSIVSDFGTGEGRKEGEGAESGKGKKGSDTVRREERMREEMKERRWELGKEEKQTYV